MRRSLSTALLCLLCTGIGALALAQGGDAADAARRATPLATLPGHTITVGEMEDHIAAQGAYMAARYRDASGRRALLRQMIEAELLAAEAERRGFGERMTVVKLEKEHAVETMIRVDFDERLTPDSLALEEVRAYYDGHLDEFARPEIVRAAHILLADRESAEALMEEAAAGDVAAFRQLARDRSVDIETKDRGGDLRYFTREGRPPGGRDAPVDAALVEAAFGLPEVGDVTSEPIALGENFSILKLTGRRDAESNSFEEVEGGLRIRLWRQQRQEEIEALIGQLRSASVVVRHLERVSGLEISRPAGALPPAP